MFKNSHLCCTTLINQVILILASTHHACQATVEANVFSLFTFSRTKWNKGTIGVTYPAVELLSSSITPTCLFQVLCHQCNTPVQSRSKLAWNTLLLRALKHFRRFELSRFLWIGHISFVCLSFGKCASTMPSATLHSTQSYEGTKN